MATPYIGEIKMFGGNFAPLGWAMCSGQLVAISDNSALFALIGTTYGGDGQVTFALPDLQSRVPIHMGQGPGLPSFTIGETSGTETVTLTTNQLPIHSHVPLANSGNGTTTNPQNNFWAAQPALLQYASPPTDSNLKVNAITPMGGNQPHENLQPYLVVTFIIALFGVFPSRN